jgi:anti-sigma regulatory factor (Ser/Thr protein kinase)
MPMQIQIENKLDELAGVMAALEKFADSSGLDVATSQAAELVLDELLANIISYGYTDAGVHQISVELNVIDGAMTIRIDDDGLAFNPFERDAPDLESSIERRELGGLGIHLVKKFMDEFSYQRLDDRNIVILSKNLY